jgi:predicted nucleotidyltransferase
MTEKIQDPEGNTVPGASTMDVEDRDIESMIVLMVPVLKERGVKRAGVFGSFVRGEATGDSDLDLVVELDEGASLLDLAGIKVDLEDLLGLSIDVTTYNALHPLLRDQILREERVII